MTLYCKENYFCRIAREIMILACTQVTVLVHCQGTGFMKAETHQNIGEGRCSMTPQGLMDIYLESNSTSILKNLTLIRSAYTNSW